MDWLAIIVGAVLLILGRLLFWVFVGGTGFMVGLRAAPHVFPDQPSETIFLIALGCGLAGVLLSIFLQRIAVMLAGIVVGGYLAFHFAGDFDDPVYHWLAVIGGALVGGLLILFLFDWALIVLSAFTGAALISEEIPIEPSMKLALFGILFLGGTFTQWRLWKRPSSRKP